jgi:activating signal cointegrator complex subunit 3
LYADLFAADKDPKFKFAMDAVSKSRNKELNQLFPRGFSMHHAGMLRSDRNIVEKYFSEGLIKVTTPFIPFLVPFSFHLFQFFFFFFFA